MRHVDWKHRLVVGRGDNFSRFIKDIVTLTCPGLCPTPAMATKKIRRKSHQVYQSAAQNGMQFAYATNSCLDKRVLLGQAVMLIDVPTENVSFTDSAIQAGNTHLASQG